MKYKIGDKIITKTKYYGQIIEIVKERKIIRILFDKKRHPEAFSSHPRGYTFHEKDVWKHQCRLKNKRERK